MGLSELAAFDAAYRALAPLDLAARRRALQWLSDALGDSVPLRQDAVEAEADQRAQNAKSTDSPRRRPVKAAALAGRRAKAVTSQPKQRGRRKTIEVTAESARAYRRMPPVAEVMAAYRKVGSISGLAEQFEVPVYTVHAWARKLRGEGFQIGRGA